MKINIGCGDDMWGDVRVDYGKYTDAVTHALDLNCDSLPCEDSSEILISATNMKPGNKLNPVCPFIGARILRAERGQEGGII